MAAVQPIRPQVVYMIERAPAPEAPAAPTTLDKVKKVVGLLLATLGLSLIIAASFTLLSTAAVDLTLFQTLFMSGLAGTIGGFHLASGSSLGGTDFEVGPLTFAL